MRRSPGKPGRNKAAAILPDVWSKLDLHTHPPITICDKAHEDGSPTPKPPIREGLINKGSNSRGSIGFR